MGTRTRERKPQRPTLPAEWFEPSFSLFLVEGEPESHRDLPSMAMLLHGNAKEG